MSTVNALVAAARDGDVKQIKNLAKQCDINARDEIGWCAIHRAAVHSQIQSLRDQLKAILQEALSGGE